MALKKFYLADKIEAGCDEAGRGCLAGPVFAAAVIFPADYENPEIKDSKKITETKRYLLKDEIIKSAISYGIAHIDHQEIDKINIFKASMKAMHAAIYQLAVKPDLLLIDGHLFTKYNDLPHVCIVKGDNKYLSIAAASILAKTFRDDYMKNIHKEYPMYEWAKNKGYGTSAHRKAINNYGLTPYHRRSFKIADSQLSFNF